MKREDLPLSATVVIQRVARGGAFDGRLILEADLFNVQSTRIDGADRWVACRVAGIDSPVHVTGSLVIIMALGAPRTQATPVAAARVMWDWIVETYGGRPDTWVVDDAVPATVRPKVSVMPLAEGSAILNALALTRTPKIMAAAFLARHAPVRDEVSGKTDAPRLRARAKPQGRNAEVRIVSDDPAPLWIVVLGGIKCEVTDLGPSGIRIMRTDRSEVVWEGRRTSSGYQTQSTTISQPTLDELLALVWDGDPQRARPALLLPSGGPR